MDENRTEVSETKRKRPRFRGGMSHEDKRKVVDLAYRLLVKQGYVTHKEFKRRTLAELGWEPTHASWKKYMQRAKERIAQEQESAPTSTAPTSTVPPAKRQAPNKAPKVAVPQRTEFEGLLMQLLDYMRERSIKSVHLTSEGELVVQRQETYNL